jgi:hypothetical protein
VTTPDMATASSKHRYDPRISLPAPLCRQNFQPRRSEAEPRWTAASDSLRRSGLGERTRRNPLNVHGVICLTAPSFGLRGPGAAARGSASSTRRPQGHERSIAFARHPRISPPAGEIRQGVLAGQNAWSGGSNRRPSAFQGALQVHARQASHRPLDRVSCRRQPGLPET